MRRGFCGQWLPQRVVPRADTGVWGRPPDTQTRVPPAVGRSCEVAVPPRWLLVLALPAARRGGWFLAERERGGRGSSQALPGAMGGLAVGVLGDGVARAHPSPARGHRDPEAVAAGGCGAALHPARLVHGSPAVSCLVHLSLHLPVIKSDFRLFTCREKIQRGTVGAGSFSLSVCNPGVRWGEENPGRR